LDIVYVSLPNLYYCKVIEYNDNGLHYYSWSTRHYIMMMTAVVIMVTNKPFSRVSE